MIDVDEAQPLLEPIKDHLVNAHVDAMKAWSRLVTDTPALALPLCATTRAGFIHDHVVREVARTVTLPGYTPTDALDSFGLLIGTDILLRFKYVGKGRPRNVRTTRQKFLAKQTFTESMVIELMGDSGLTPPTLLTCGYTIDGMEIGRIEIRRDCKGHLPWSYDIHGGESLIEPRTFQGMSDNTKPAKVADAEPATISSPAKKTRKGPSETEAG